MSIFRSKHILLVILCSAFLILLIRNSYKEMEMSLQLHLRQAEENLQLLENEFKHVNIKTVHSQYVLIALNNISNRSQTISNPNSNADSNQAIAKQELLELFDFFHESNLYLLDVDILEGVFKSEKGLLNTKLGLVDFNKAEEFSNRTFHLEKIKTLFDASASDNTHINYGISVNDFEDFYKVRFIWYFIGHELIVLNVLCLMFRV